MLISNMCDVTLKIENQPTAGDVKDRYEGDKRRLCRKLRNNFYAFNVYCI